MEQLEFIVGSLLGHQYQIPLFKLVDQQLEESNLILTHCQIAKEYQMIKHYLRIDFLLQQQLLLYIKQSIFQDFQVLCIRHIWIPELLMDNNMIRLPTSQYQLNCMEVDQLQFYYKLQQLLLGPKIFLVVFLLQECNYKMKMLLHLDHIGNGLLCMIN